MGAYCQTEPWASNSMYGCRGYRQENSRRPPYRTWRNTLCRSGGPKRLHVGVARSRHQRVRLLSGDVGAQANDRFWPVADIGPNNGRYQTRTCITATGELGREVRVEGSGKTEWWRERDS